MYRYLNNLLVVLLFGVLFASTVAAQSIHVEWGYTPPSEPAVTGYKLYQEGVAVCSTQDPNATAMDCNVTLTATTTNFTLTATFNDNTESPHSAPFAFTSAEAGQEGATDTGGSGNVAPPLQAAIQATPVTGTAPLSVNFSAASSTGTITQYQWDFADGSTARTATVDHQYTTAGKFIATLTIHDATGASSSSTVEVNITAPEAPAPPEIINIEPTVVISTSTSAVGPAPLNMSFDGSASRANGSATIANYLWSFGDGTSSTGATVTHSFKSAGTYAVTLTITDSNNLSNSTSTPVIVTPAVSNNAPKAAICEVKSTGTFPLTVSFDGSCSTDSDGSIASYIWSFGDGSVGSGKTASHTFTTEAEFLVTLQVSDNQGAIGTATTKITAEEESAPDLNIETGEVSVSGTWAHVALNNTFQNPIVIAGPPSFQDAAPGVIRLRNVTATGFDIKFAEWDYLDGAHASETVSYIVLEKGRHTLPDGSMIEAGSFAGSTTFATVNFSQALSKTPVVLTTIASMNEADVISGRIKRVTTKGFAYAFREQERNRNVHKKETVNFIAWEPGSGTIGELKYQVQNTSMKVKEAWYPVTLANSSATTPFILADMQTISDTDTCALRIRQVAATGFQVKVEEEQSKDREVFHRAAEMVGFIKLDQNP